MMRHTARFADTWNSMSFLETFEDQLAETAGAMPCHGRSLATEIGRSPASLRRSYLMFDSQARHRGGSIGIYESRERFVESVAQIVARDQRYWALLSGRPASGPDVRAHCPRHPSPFSAPNIEQSDRSPPAELSQRWASRMRTGSVPCRRYDWKRCARPISTPVLV